MVEVSRVCLIVDANRMGVFLEDPTHPDAAPVHRWLNRGDGNLVYSIGRKFDSEVPRRGRDRLAAYVKAGRAKLIPAGDFLEEERRLEEEGALRSDDAHVLALARVSGARLLYTGDRLVIDDFTGPEILKKPRGKIYSGAKNEDLLNRTVCLR